MTKEIVASSGGQVVPDYLKEYENKGPVTLNDNFGVDDMAVPRIKLLQGLSKECEMFDTAKAGNFWHTGMDVSLGNEIDFVICTRRRKLLLVAPMEDGQGILARSDDCVTWDRVGKWQVKIKGVKNPVTWEIKNRNVALSGLSEKDWGTYNPFDGENSPPAATLFYEYLILLPDRLDLGPAVLSLARSAIARAKKGLNDKISGFAQNGRPLQSIVYRARVTNEKNSDGQDFKNYQFMSNGFASAEVFAKACRIAETMANYKVKDEADVDENKGIGAKSDSKDF